MEREKTMQKLIWMLLMMWAGAFGSANAAEFWEGCNSCTPSQQRWAAKRAVPADTAGQFDVYVMDFEREKVHKFFVGIVFDPREGGYLSDATKVATEAHISYEFEQTVQGIKNDIASFEAGTVIPGDVAGSAYDIVHSAIRQKDVSEYINNHLSIWEAIAAPVSIPMTAFGKIIKLNITVSVSFSDGSAAKFVLTGIEGTLFDMRYAFELKGGSARDADGNLIPANSADAAPYVGVFSTQDVADEMVAFILRWYAGERPLAVNCTSEAEPEGITVTCKRR